MDVSPILSPAGEPIFVAGGPDAWKTVQYREWIVSLEWFKGTRRGIQKCLVIWPAGVAGAIAPGKWAIADRVAVEFVGFKKDGTCDGSVSQHAIEEATEALPMLGRDRNDKAALFSLLDALMRFLPELATMPVASAEIQRKLRGDAMFDVTATNKSTGKTISESSA